jgi:molybdate transport system substrate-binding protein
MNLLETKGLIEKGSRKNRLSNFLVIVTTREDGPAITGPSDLAGPAIKRVVLGNPRAVPVGVYARQYLEGLKLWGAVEPKVVAAENARAALAAVESGNVDAGIVYKTDAALSSKVKIVFEIPPSQGPVIRYPMALVKESNNPEAARKFMDRLESQAAGRVFARFGYVVLEVADKR